MAVNHLLQQTGAVFVLTYAFHDTVIRTKDVWKLLSYSPVAVVVSAVDGVVTLSVGVAVVVTASNDK